MSVERWPMWINGERTAGTGGWMKVIDPSNQAVIAEVPAATKEDVDAAIRNASTAMQRQLWSGSTPGERASVLWRLGDLIESNIEELSSIESRNAGKPIKLSRESDFILAIDNVRFFATAARHLEGRANQEYAKGYTSWIRREPLGVVAAIAPWNYPFLMAVWKVMPALAAGNAVVLKPAGLTPLSALRLAELAGDAGVPPGVFSVITGRGSEIGDSIVGHPLVSMVSLTGDTATGQRVMEVAARTVKRCHLELGGKAPFLVLEDVDLEAAVKGAVVGAFQNTGQDCTAATRIYVPRHLLSIFLDRLVAEVETVRLGPTAELSTDIGPLISSEQRRRVEEYVNEAVKDGIKLIIGGNRPEDPAIAAGFYYEPTVLVTENQKARVVQEEIFGPVLVILPYDTYDEGIERANDVPYGLAASVWTASVQRALDASARLRFGTVWINDHIPLVSEMPHGGLKQSGYGKDMSLYALEEYTFVKHVMADVTGQQRKYWHYTVYGPR